MLVYLLIILYVPHYILVVNVLNRLDRRRRNTRCFDLLNTYTYETGRQKASFGEEERERGCKRGRIDRRTDRQADGRRTDRQADRRWTDRI